MKTVPVEKTEKQYQEEVAISAPRLLDPISTVESVVTRALETSARKMGVGNIDAFIDCLKKHDATAFSYCHYHIAKELGIVLGSWNKNIRNVYAYNYDNTDSDEDGYANILAFSLIHIIVWAEQKTKALNALIEAIDRLMVQHYRRMLGLKSLEHVLDIQVIDDEDVRNCTGYAALLKSLYQPPIQVWGQRL